MNAAEEFWGAVEDVRARIDGWTSAMKSDPSWPEFVEECNARAFAAWMEQRATAGDAARAVVNMGETMTDIDLLNESHWCPWCEHQPSLRIERIDRENYPGVALLATCPTHGRQVHDPGDTDCWCVK